MSNFIGPARHPKTGKVEQSATWLDKGRKGYTVVFSDGSEWPAHRCEIEHSGTVALVGGADG